MTREGLITNGTEFLLPDGSPYRGPYHVHVSQGAMVGARHKSQPHSILIAVNPEVAEKVVKIQNELKQQDFLANAPRVSLSSSEDILEAVGEEGEEVPPLRLAIKYI